MGAEVMVPGTGELLDLSELPTDEIAGYIERFDEFSKEMGRFKAAASDVLAERLDHEGKRSGEVGDWKISVNPPVEKEWDIPKLRATLDAFVEKGLISRAKADRCIRWKLSAVWNEVKTLLSDPRVAPEISLSYTEVPTRRSVRVERIT